MNVSLWHRACRERFALPAEQLAMHPIDLRIGLEILQEMAAIAQRYR
jgi:hypothetical protein